MDYEIVTLDRVNSDMTDYVFWLNVYQLSTTLGAYGHCIALGRGAGVQRAIASLERSTGNFPKPLEAACSDSHAVPSRTGCCTGCISSPRCACG